jgi:ribosomal protein S18 acetylase RimI-like enzyme
MLSLDPTILRARAWDHGGRPLTSAALSRVALGDATGIVANGLVFVAEQDAPAARDAAIDAGLTDAGTASLMAMDLDDALAEAPCQGVERAIDPATVEEVAELVRAAFALHGSTGLRHDMAEVPGADAWLRRDRDGRAVAALVATADPDLVGIWSMATHPDRRHEGHGGCLLRAVLGHYALEGAARACLITTGSGEGLYREVGFRPVEQLSVWHPA